ncbi:MAG: M28 family peptidase [Bacteroidota bacterium]
MLKINSGRAQWLLIFVTCLSMMITGCGEDKPQGGGGTTGGGTTGGGGGGTKFKAVAPTFDADSAYQYVKAQLDFGPRVPNSPAHAACAEWFKQKFEAFGAKVKIQEAIIPMHDGARFAIKNVIASYKPEQARRIMITCHWDSRPMADKDEDPAKHNMPVPGANDGASGAGVILELARQIQQKAPEIGVDFMLWDAEDYGAYSKDNSWCEGSRYWTKNQHVANYRPKFGINLDMVGAKDARFTMDGYSIAYARTECDKVWNIAHNLGYGVYFPLQDMGFATLDDHKVIMDNAGIRMVELIDRDLSTGSFFPYWHTTKDDLASIDQATLKAVGQTVMEVIYREK